MIKRFLKSAILATMGMLLFCGVASATWQFIFPITVADTSGVTRVYYPVMLGFGGQSLVDSAKISASGNNTNIQIGSANISYMMSTTNVTAVIPTLPAGGLVSTSLYTGFSPKQSGFPIIVGDSGNVTVSDNATLEPADNFTHQTTGWINTDVGEGKYLGIKESAYRVYVSPIVAENITADIFSPTPGNETLRPDGNSICVLPNEVGVACPNHWQNVDEAVVNDGDLVGILNAADNKTDVYTLANTAIPGTAIISSVTATIRGEDNGTNGEFRAGLRIGADTTWGTYWSDAAYTTHTEALARPGGGDWEVSDLNGLLYCANARTAGGADTCFISWCYITINYDVDTILATVTATGVSSGEHSVEVTANTTTFWINVDGGAIEDSVALGGATVPDNANDWTFMAGNSVSYADNITLLVNGTQHLYFAPTTMLVGATIPDRGAGVDNPGTINWGSNTNVNISYGEMQSFEDYIASVAALGGFEMPEATLPSTWFASGENLANLPFYDAFSKVAAQTGRPVQMIYAVGIIGLAFGAFLMVVSFTRSALLAWFAMVFVFIIGSSMTIIPWWIPFVLILTGLAIMYLYRQVSR